METYLIYIGKSALAAGTFYLLYLALFQHQKHFVFNRIYLPLSLAVSFFIPLITFTTIKYIEPVNSLNVNSFAYLPEATNTTEPAFVYEWYHYLFGIYLLGTIGFLFHLLLGHVKAIRIIRFSSIKELFGAQVNITQKDVHPFSFFNKIVLSEKTLHNPSLKVIVSHEKIHVDEKHTLDILFAEILFLLQWFNPFAWLLKDAMRNNLEYLTDHQITQNNNAEAYQLAMVGLAHKEGVAPFLTALNGSQLKNRILMMKKKTENKYALLKQLVALPLLAVLVMGLSNKEVRTEIVQAKKEVKVVVDGNAIPTNHPALTSINFTDDFDGGEISKALGVEDKIVSNTLAFDENSENATYYLQTSDYRVGTNPEFDEQMGNKKTEEHTKLTETFYAVNNKLVEKDEFEKIPSAQIESPVILTAEHASKKYGEKVKSGLVIDVQTVQEKQKDSVKGKVTNEKGDPIPAASVLVKESTLITTKDTATIKNKDGGKEVRHEKQENGALYNSGIINIVIDSEKHPLYIVDGKGAENIDNLHPIDIKSISVLKDASATSLYGEKGKNGVVLVTTKKAVILNNKEDVKVVSYGKQAPNSNADFVKQHLHTGGKTQPMYIIDGKETSDMVSYENLDLNEVESISVLKDESATSLYGEKGKNGAIIITTKQAEITSELLLRKFIAKKIKYPQKALHANKEGIAQLFVKVNNDGVVNSVSDKSVDDAIFVEEVVVVSYAPKSKEANIMDKIEDLSGIFNDETKQLINQLPKLQVSEYQGQTLAITIKFVLQDK